MNDGWLSSPTSDWSEWMIRWFIYILRVRYRVTFLRNRLNGSLNKWVRLKYAVQCTFVHLHLVFCLGFNAQHVNCGTMSSEKLRTGTLHHRIYETRSLKALYPTLETMYPVTQVRNHIGIYPRNHALFSILIICVFVFTFNAPLESWYFNVKKVGEIYPIHCVLNWVHWKGNAKVVLFFALIVGFYWKDLIFNGIMSWPKVSSLVFRFWSLP